MSLAEDIPQPENGFYVLVTGANRYDILYNAEVHAIDHCLVA